MYARKVEGRTLTFGVSGKLVRNSLIMFDRQTGSLWSHLTGDAIAGPLQGEHLELIPARQTTWKLWRKEWPGSLMLKVDPSEARGDPYSGYYQDGSSGVLGRKHPADNRLPDKEKVIGVRLDGRVKAYAFSALARDRVVNDEVGGVPIVLVFDSNSESGAVYRRDPGGKLLDFQPGDSPLGMRDIETGSSWNGLGGEATGGSLSGTTLEDVPITYSFWFGWSDFYPGTEVYG